MVSQFLSDVGVKEAISSMIINHTIRQINPINQKELIETSSKLRNVLGKHMDIIKQLDPLPSEREKTKKFRKELIKSFGKFCAICNSDHQIDTYHIVPLEIGGETEIENLILLCKKHHTLCHSGYLSINSKTYYHDSSCKYQKYFGSSFSFTAREEA